MKTIDLSGAWRLRVSGIDRLEGREVPCAVPGDGHSALLAAGLIPDPYYDRNELAVQDLGGADWKFEREFEVSAADLAAGRPFVHFDSIDTIAEVSVNGVRVAAGTNMFRAVRAGLSGLLKPGRNVVAVVCRSAEKEAARRAAAHPYPVPTSQYPVQSPHRNFVRKVACHAGWDWGPCLMVAGIYGRAFVGFAAPGRAERLSASVRKEDGAWLVEAEVEYLVESGSGEVALDLSLRDPEGREVAKAALPPSPVHSGTRVLALDLEVEEPRLWNPAGYGERTLYVLRAELRSAEGIQVLEKRIGFRDLRVVAEEDELGRSLLFRVNGRDVWAKGANWIPFDGLPSRQTSAKREALLRSMVDANMNMVRVWGGGKYEDDAFYDLCDELGILVWQDMMYSCSLYPADPAFLEDARAEADHQVRRLKEHPCIALWCGNNENVGALTWYPESRANRDRYLIDYDRLNEGAVGSAVRAADPDRTWWPSSPSAGPGDFTDCWHADGRGDMHYWSVWHEGKPFEAYYDVLPRFCSEFGYQSFPSEEGVAAYCPEDQRNLTSPAMEHHQKNPRGNSIIIENFSRYFRFPAGLPAMLYLSQVQQGLAIKTAVEYWRSRRPACMGALYWQLDDCWPVASWSSLEYSGKWKLLHFMARRFFAPEAAVAWKKDGTARAFVLNDGAEALRAVLELKLVRFDGTVAAAEEIRVEVPADSAAEAWSRELAALPVKPEEAYLSITLRKGGDVVFRNELFLAEPKKCELRDPGLSWAAATVGGKIGMRLKAAKPAFYVAPEARGLDGRFEDSCFGMDGGEERFLRWIPAEGAAAPTEAALAAAFSAAHLRGTY